MDTNKSKSVSTSVPSISIKFHANVEQIEELYGCDDGMNSSSEKRERTSTDFDQTVNIESDTSSPLKYFPKLGKRSSSIDIIQSQNLDSSPPSDPWRFFSGIRGKIEEKITEIKARNQEEGSPHHKSKLDSKIVKDGKQSSSVSDSEDFSESSISKTCGLISTTEGVEMSSDEDTPSLEEDKKEDQLLPSSLVSSSLRQRFRFFKNKLPPEEGNVGIEDLSKLYNINTDNIEHTLATAVESGDVESAVDALEETDFKNGSVNNIAFNKDMIKYLSIQYDNIEVDTNGVINVKEVTGDEIRKTNVNNFDVPRTFFAPTGFVDLRPVAIQTRPLFDYFPYILFSISILLYVVIHRYSLYAAGFMIGIIVSYIFFQLYTKWIPRSTGLPVIQSKTSLMNNIFEVQAVKEFQPPFKYEGWVNEYPDAYNPDTYHISQTQSVFLRLQGNLLRLSHPTSKVPKRAMWNETEVKPIFSHHRIYNLSGAKISLFPEGLAKKRHWSKKYPICITLSKDQISFDPSLLSTLHSEIDKTIKKEKSSSNEQDENTSLGQKKVINRFKKKEYPVLAQRFSKLTEDEEFDFDSDSRASTPSADMSDCGDSPLQENDDFLNKSNEPVPEDVKSMTGDCSVCSPEDSPTGLKIYLFGRTDREKEDWFRKLTAAIPRGIDVLSKDHNSSENILQEEQTDLVEYMKYMSVFKHSLTHNINKENPEPILPILEDSKEDLLWLNALIGRVLFDCMGDPNFTLRIKDRIERKLSTIKLPYFIEELLISELSLGKTPPIIHHTRKPILDQRGLWVDLEITYEGAVVLTLQTKLNLMRLKNPQAYDKKPTTKVRSAIYHSDVDDSAESSSDEEGPQELPNILQESASSSLINSSGSGNSGKKFIKMVDRLAESKIFQAATENRYIKKAMEGVSNTELRLTVEVKSIVGTLVLNIPQPPSDRIWVGFRPLPEIILSARPIVGERNITYFMVTRWIEKKLLQEFQKVMVIPNMEDFIIPVMNSKLPE